MKKVGTIKNISGFRNWKSAFVCLDGERYVITNQNQSIDLSEHLAAVSFDLNARTSTIGVLARTVLGAISGLTWARGKAGIAGAAVGFGSSINTQSEIISIALTFTDGESLYGETDRKTASLLKTISPQYSSSELIAMLADEEEFSRFLDDAPRTYYEAKSEIKALEEELKDLDQIKQSGDTFKIRDDASQRHIQLQHTYNEKKAILDVLEFRAKAVKAFGDFDTFNNQQAPLHLRIKQLENKLKPRPINKIALGIFAFCILGFFVSFGESDAEIHRFYFVINVLFITYYFSRFIFRLVIRTPRKQKLLKLQNQYNEKYGLNNIQL